MSDAQKHQHCTERFVEMANEMKNEGYDVQLVSSALMAASGIYATYSVAGNEGGLNPSGVDKVVERYRKSLDSIQSIKKANAELAKKQGS